MPAYPKRFNEGRFGEYVSVGGYASAGFAEDVKMPRAEARGASQMGRLKAYALRFYAFSFLTTL